MKSALPDLPLGSEQTVPYVTFHYEYLGMFVWFLPGLKIKKNNIKGKPYLFKPSFNQHHTKIASLGSLNSSTAILIHL